MGGGHSGLAVPPANKYVTTVSASPSAPDMETVDISATSSETLIRDQLNAKRRSASGKKNGVKRTHGIQGTTGFDLDIHTKRGAYDRPKQIEPKSVETLKVLSVALENHFLFHALSKVSLGTAVDFMEKVEVKAGVNIITQGDQGKHFYVLEHGAAKVIINGTDINKPLQPGASFGELALLYEEPRSATIVTTEDSKLWSLESDIFRRSLASQNLQWEEGVSSMLKDIPLFQNLQKGQLDAVAECMQEVFIPNGANIVTQGELGHIFYVILEGNANVYVWDNEENKTPVFVHALGKNDFFGERALLSADPRSATIVANGQVKCGAIDRETFTSLIGPLKPLLDQAFESQTECEQSMRTKFLQNRIEYKCVLEDLEIKGVLGRGAFGFVYLVHNRKNEDRYAMKKISKVTVIEKAQQENITREKTLLASMDHPLLPKLFLSSQDTDCLYLVLELLQGGDLFSALVDRPDQVFDEVHSVFYTACIVEALAYMHSNGILYRDLKPENVVIAANGYVKLVDFGFAKRCKRSFTMCGTQDYISPEMILGRGHGKGVDYWALGNVLFEFIYGYLPFNRNSVSDTFGAIVSGDLEITPYDEPWLTGSNVLIENLLNTNVAKRWGCGHMGVAPIRNCLFFSDIDWSKLAEIKIQPPSIPKCYGPDDVSNFKDVDVEGIKAGVKSYSGDQKCFENC